MESAATSVVAAPPPILGCPPRPRRRAQLPADGTDAGGTGFGIEQPVPCFERLQPLLQVLRDRPEALALPALGVIPRRNVERRQERFDESDLQCQPELIIIDV